MTVILLAAGLSERMGKNKLLLPFRGKTILTAELETILSFTDHVIVVTGHENTLIEDSIKEYNVQTINALNYMKGQKWSTLAGLEAIKNDDFAIIPGDLPHIEISDLAGTAELLDRYTIARAYHKGTPGHPVMYRKEHRKELLSFCGSMKEYLAMHETGRYEGSIGCIADADTPDKYQQLLEKEMKAGTF